MTKLHPSLRWWINRASLRSSGIDYFVMDYGELWNLVGHDSNAIKALFSLERHYPIDGDTTGIASNYYKVRLTDAGLAYLYQDAPMVDQPQPITDVGTDDEDTKELTPIVVESTPTLHELVDTALTAATPCQRIDALNQLRNLDWEFIPLSMMESELVDVNAAFNDAMVMRRNRRIRVLYGVDVTPQDVKAYAAARTFCNLVGEVSSAIATVYHARANHIRKVGYPNVFS